MTRPRSLLDSLAVPADRRSGLRAILASLESVERLILTTHVNADGDGVGSQVALAAWLGHRGKRVTIVNPTPFPARFRYLLTPEIEVVELDDPRVRGVLTEAELLFVVDTGEPKRIGKLARVMRDRSVLVLDHHPRSETGIDSPGVRDPGAAATGELVYDLLLLADAEEPWPEPVVDALYAAVATDTGSFRFSNTSVRAHLIVADLIRRGVEPEASYRRLYARMSMRKIEILRVALDSLERDPEAPLAWISLPKRVTTEIKATPDDLDGIIDYARNLEGTEVAVLFRETVEGGTKISLRSNGPADVNAIAREFGGGGHAKAAGILLGEPIEQARSNVLDAVRRALAALEPERNRD